jgi:hypothetical protein
VTLCGLSNLGVLDLSQNQLSGPILSCGQGELSNLWGLVLWGNQLSGRIPPELGNLTELISLSLGVNPLIGDIPQELCQLSELEDLCVNHSSLSGPLPRCLMDLSLTCRPGECEGDWLENGGRFWYVHTGLCESSDDGFQDWLQAIPDRQGTGVLCPLFSCNDLLNLDNTVASYNPTPVPHAPGGVYTISATFSNVSSSTLRDLFFQVVTLTGGNVVLNADGGPGGEGATVSVPPESLGDNGILEPGEPFTVDFEIGLAALQPFSFYVDAYGVSATGAGADLSLLSGSGDADSFQFEMQERHLQPDQKHRSR